MTHTPAKVLVRSKGDSGPPGKSAYDIAVDNGFTGSERDWLDSFYGGAQGPQGERGHDGQIRFTGHGPPGTLIGARPNDTYMDLDTGDIYKLT